GSLSGVHDGRLPRRLCGGEALAGPTYRGGDLSLLNIAQVRHWPELGLADLRRLAARQMSDHSLAEDRLDELLQLCGGHPALAEERSEEHTLNSSHVKISYAVFCLKKK